MNRARDNRQPNINRMQENKVFNQNFNKLIRFRAGSKPDWDKNNSSDEDIFNENFDDLKTTSKIDMKKAVDLKEHLMERKY
jgi:uridine kinase